MNMDELQALSARFFRTLSPAGLVRSIRLPDGDPWYALSPEIQEELAAGLRENAATPDELRALVPHFTAREVAYTPQVLKELVASRHLHLFAVVVPNTRKYKLPVSHKRRQFANRFSEHCRILHEQ